MDKQLRLAKARAVRRILLIGVVLIAVGTGITMAWDWAHRYNYAIEQAAVTPVREMLIDAVKNVKTDAPVDPKTGDIYFPPAKLYVPNDSSYVRLMYAYDKDADVPLSISSTTVLNQGIASLYNAQNTLAVFERLPYLQACQRGVSVLYEQTDAQELELRQTVKLNNGKTVYLYIEKACPELGETADLLKDLRAY